MSLLWIDFKMFIVILHWGWWWSHFVAIFYYVYMYICIYTFMTTSWLSILVILRSTTGPYGRPIVEVAYGEMLFFSLHRGCMGVDSSGRVVGVSTWCRPCWTHPDQHQCELTIYCFQDFYIIKTKYIYIYDFSKLYIV